MAAIDADKIKTLTHENIIALGRAQASSIRRGGAVFHAARNRAILLYRTGIDFEILDAYAVVSVGAPDASMAFSAINLAYLTTIYPEQFTVQEADALTIAWRSVMGDDGFL